MKLGKYVIGRIIPEMGLPLSWGWKDGLTPICGVFIKGNFWGVGKLFPLDTVIGGIMAEDDEQEELLKSHPPTSPQFLPKMEHDFDRLTLQAQLMSQRPSPRQEDTSFMDRKGPGELTILSDEAERELNHTLLDQ